LPIYYTRELIEQFFDILKTYVGVLSLRGHSEKTIRGLLLIAFISSAVYTYLGKELAGLKFSAHLALIKMGNAIIKIYSDTELLEELTKDQKDIFEKMQLNNPYEVEKGNLLQNKPFFHRLKSGSKKRGRPAGVKNKPTYEFQQKLNQNIKSTSKRGRPKGAKNKNKHGK
jgi:hypothetical protein